MEGFDRRGLLKAAGAVIATGASLAPLTDAFAGTRFYADVDAELFNTINRVKDPANMTGLELHHVPQFKLPEKVTKGEPFLVEVTVGRELHTVSEAHRVVNITLLAGNEPISYAIFESTLAHPGAAFIVSLDKPVTLVAQARCNLHGLWEASVDVDPA